MRLIQAGNFPEFISVNAARNSYAVSAANTRKKSSIKKECGPRTSIGYATCARRILPKFMTPLCKYFFIYKERHAMEPRHTHVKRMARKHVHFPPKPKQKSLAKVA